LFPGVYAFSTLLTLVTMLIVISYYFIKGGKGREKKH